MDLRLPLPRAGRSLFLIATLCIAGCSDGIIGPNTDVGLSVWADVYPPRLSVRDSATVITMGVNVVNKSNHVIRVVSGGPPYVFTNDPKQNRGTWGSVRVGTEEKPLNAGPSSDWWGDSVYVFAPRSGQRNETRATLRDWSARGWDNLPPGRYTIRGWFNTREGESATFILTP